MKHSNQDESTIKTLLGYRILWDTVTWTTTWVINRISADRFCSSDTEGKVPLKVKNEINES